MLKRIAMIVLLALAAMNAPVLAKKKNPANLPPQVPADKIPEQSGYASVVPSDGLPPEVTLQNANNNLDVVRHDGRIFLGFRTAPKHFASDVVEMYIISSEDQVNWDFEAKFFRQTDLREPRFLSWNGKLFMYFAVLGADQMDFEPQGMMMTEYQGPGKWTEPEWVVGKGFIPWRTKTIGGVPYMLTYSGGENIYDFQENSAEILHFLTTEDGRNWHGVDPDKPVVYEGGCSETDFEFADNGDIIAVCRNELGDKQGFGSKICRAKPDAPGDWTCNPDPKKYDSPLVFKHGGDIYLVGRRNLSKTGNFDLGKSKMPYKNQLTMYQLDYWKRPKRCSLWWVDPEALEVKFVSDLPSKGDTCFASMVPMSEHEFMIYNYTSPPDGPDISWNQGQQEHTLIYRILLTFPH